ncbi:unnamed protein product [Thlaspi arvense]|uniref:Rhodanese domain-containing protein n=1 Tax=Thlaspi arvense TaxID=13288 RepID=A0AAU9RML0_THLAR|nr:unnamed protein product [Thlaspi arvense]
MFPSVCSSKPEEVVTVDVSQAKTLLQSGHRYLDVRTEEEFRRGHCLASEILNVPYMLNTPQGRVKNQDFLDQVSSLLNPTDDVLVFEIDLESDDTQGCQSGARSLNATAELLAAGFKKVRNVGGGYLAWVDHSFPINKEQQSAN